MDAQEVQASLQPGSVYLVQLLLAILAMVVLGCLYGHPFVPRDGVQQLLEVELAGSIANTLENKEQVTGGLLIRGVPSEHFSRRFRPRLNIRIGPRILRPLS